MSLLSVDGFGGAVVSGLQDRALSSLMGAPTALCRPSPQPDRATDSTLTLSIIHRNDNKRRLGCGRGIRNLDDVMGNCTAHSSKMNIGDSFASIILASIIRIE